MESRLYQEYYKIKFGKGFIYKTYRFNFQKLYRGRLFKEATPYEILKEVKDFSKIWVPRKEVASKQRCSESSEPLLYLTNHSTAIPLELGIKKMDFFIVTEFDQLSDFMYIPIIGWQHLMQLESQGISKIVQDYFNDKPAEIINIDKTISKIFILERRKNLFYDSYDKSIALSNLFLKNQKSEGILYPSIADNFNAVNLALKPSKVQDKLKPNSVKLYRLIKHENNSMIVEKLFNGQFEKDTKISWTRTPEKLHYNILK